jgi:hypothetical protein
MRNESKPARREREVGLEQPLELEERLVVERDEVHILELDARLREAVVERVAREARVMLLPRETFLLRGRDDLAVAHDGRCGVVIERGDADDVHQNNV